MYLLTRLNYSGSLPESVYIACMMTAEEAPYMTNLPSQTA